jgi:hypothetical protein
LVKDNSGTAKVALWEKAAEEEYEENSVIKIKHVRGTTFNKMHLIGTTNTSTVEVNVLEAHLLGGKRKKSGLKVVTFSIFQDCRSHYTHFIKQSLE